MWSCCSLSVPGRFGPIDGNGYHRRMSMHRILASFALASACALAFIPSPASASDCQPQVQGGWVRLGPAGMPMMAGFGRIENNCATPVTITGASSPAFDRAELSSDARRVGEEWVRPGSSRWSPDHYKHT